MRTLLCTCLLLTTGCLRDFEKAELVIDLRILAVVAEPPEVFPPSTLGVTAEGFGLNVIGDPEPVQVQTLVTKPESDAELSYRVEACLFTDGYRCRGGHTIQVAEGSARPETFDFEFRPGRGDLNRGSSEDAFGGFGGRFVLLSSEITQGEVVEYAGKVVTYNNPLLIPAEGQDPPPPKVPNRNPRVDGLLIGEVESRDSSGILVATAGELIDLEAIFDRETEVEEYPVPTYATGDPPSFGYRILEELLEFSFFATAGEFGDHTVVTRDPRGDKMDLSSSWTAPEELGMVTLWMVTRDDRGGASWLRRQIDVVAAED